MKERRSRVSKKTVEPIVMPPDHRLIFLEKDENVIAICTHKRCGSIIFKGSDATAIGLRVLRERVMDHMGFSEDTHEVDIIHPRYPKERRILSMEQFQPATYTVSEDSENFTS